MNQMKNSYEYFKQKILQVQMTKLVLYPYKHFLYFDFFVFKDMSV